MWFRHFRKVTDVRYYADHETNTHARERLTMTDTISRLGKATASYRLIARWEMWAGIRPTDFDPDLGQESRHFNTSQPGRACALRRNPRILLTNNGDAPVAQVDRAAVS